MFQIKEDEELLHFIEASLAGIIPDKYQYILSNRITDNLAIEIEKLLGFSVIGYQNRISASRIKHICKRHGEKGEGDSSLRNIHDIAKIEHIIENFDSINIGTVNVKEYKNKDNTKAKTIILQKKLDDNYYYVIEAVPDSAVKSLFVVSAYINKMTHLLKWIMLKP